MLVDSMCPKLGEITEDIVYFYPIMSETLSGMQIAKDDIRSWRTESSGGFFTPTSSALEAGSAGTRHPECLHMYSCGLGSLTIWLSRASWAFYMVA